MKKLFLFLLCGLVLPFASALVDTSSNGSWLPIAFGETVRGDTWERTTNPDGSYTMTLGLEPYIENSNGDYVPFIFTDTANHLIVETNHGSVKLNKVFCSFEFYPNGMIQTPIYDQDGNILGYEHRDQLFNDSIVPLMADENSNDFTVINGINNASCSSSWDGQELVMKKETSAGRLEYKYILNNGKWKTQLEATNLSSLTDKKFAFTQTIDLNKDFIRFGGDLKNLDNLDGMSFDRQFLENNQDKIIDLFNGFYFDFDLAFDRLESVNIFDTGSGKSKLTFDYTFNSSVVLPGETMIIDPTYGGIAGLHTRMRDNDTTTGADCDITGSPQFNDASSYNMYKRDSASSGGFACTLTIMDFDGSDLPTNADVTDSVFNFDVGAVSIVGENCDITPVTNSGGYYDGINDYSNFWADVQDGTEYVDNDTFCTSVGSKSVDLGTSFDSYVESNIGGTLSFGLKFETMTRGGSTYRIDVEVPLLTITYSLPPDPPRLAFSDQDIAITWSAGDTNGDTHSSYEIEFYNETSGTWDQLVSQSGTGYTSSDPINDESVKLRIWDTGALGRGCPQYVMNTTLSSYLNAHWPLCYTLNDQGANGHDLTLDNGNEIYTNSSGTIFFNANGTNTLDLDVSYEAWYDYNSTDPFSITAIIETDGAHTGCIVCKKSGTGNANGWLGLYGSGTDELLASFGDGGATYSIQTSGSSISAGGVNFIAMTYDGSQERSGIKLYVDGTTTTTTDSTTIGDLTNALRVTIGATSSGADVYTDYIRDVTIWNVTLSEYQLDQMYGEFIDHYAEPGRPSLSAIEISDSGLRFSSTAGDAGSSPIINYTIRCDTNGGGWVTEIDNEAVPSPRSYEKTGLSTEDVVICQWRDHNTHGYSLWSANATDSIIIDIVQGARGDTEDKLKEFENFINENGGVYFGLSIFPFGIMLIGFMAGRKTVRIFTLITLALMGIVHASGYFVYPDWYWTLSLLLGFILVLGRQRSD